MAFTPGIVAAVVLMTLLQAHIVSAKCPFQLVDENNPRLARFRDDLLPLIPICTTMPYKTLTPCQIDCHRLGPRFVFKISNVGNCGCENDPDIEPIFVTPARSCKNFKIDMDSIRGGRTEHVRLHCSDGIEFKDANGQTICFNGTQSCNMPYFYNNDLGKKLDLSFSFRHGDESSRIEDMPNGEKIVLWSAGYPESASLSVAYNRTGITVTARTPDDEVTEVYCEPYRAIRRNGQLDSRYNPFPQFNDVRVQYRAGEYVLGTRAFGVLVVTLNNGRRDIVLPRRCYAESIAAAPELKASDAELFIPVMGFDGCLRKVRLDRECYDPGE